MSLDMKLVKKGERQPRLDLLDQGRKHLELESRYRGALRAVGWTAEMTAQLSDAVDVLDAKHAEALEKRADSKADTRREQQWVDEAKVFKRKLVIAFDDLYDDGLVRQEDYDIVKRSGRLGRSPVRISAYLADIRKQVEKYAPLLVEFGGRDALARLDYVKAELDAAQSQQETSLSELPQETLKLYETKGRVLVLIEKMNRRARLAFDGQAHILGLFNKDLILRARRRRSSSVVEPIGGTEPQGEEAAG